MAPFRVQIDKIYNAIKIHSFSNSWRYILFALEAMLGESNLCSFPKYACLLVILE